jgi:hypothetical protein
MSEIIGIGKQHQTQCCEKTKHGKFLEDPENYDIKVNRNTGHLNIQPVGNAVNAFFKLTKTEQLRVKRRVKRRYFEANPETKLELQKAKDVQKAKRKRAKQRKSTPKQ